MVENWNIILIFLVMGHIFPACSVSNEMVEIFVEYTWFFIGFTVRKTGTGVGLEASGEPGDALGWSIRSMGAPGWFPRAGPDLNSRQYWLPKGISKKAFVYFANSTAGKHLFIYMFYLCDKCSLLEVWRPFESYLKWRFFFKKKFFWTDSVGAKPCDAPMNKY